MAALSFEPLISPTLWLTLAGVAAALMVVYAWRRPAAMRAGRWIAVIALMSAGLALALLLLLNPTWLNEIDPPAGKPLLTVMIDTSTSMATMDADNNRSRYQMASLTAERLSKELQHRFEVRIRTFDTAIAPVGIPELAGRQPDGQMTDLATAISASLEQDRPRGQALLLLSDGIHNAPGGADQVRAASHLAKAMSAPVYTWTIGGQPSVDDLAVELHSPQQLAYIKQNVPIRVGVKHRGLTGARADVSLYDGDERIDRQQVVLLPEGSAEVRFQVSRDLRGLYRFEIRAEPLPGEVTQGNNVASCILRVVDEPIRVLLLEGKPYWDAKFLMRTLSSDPVIALDSVIRLTDGRLLRRTLSRATASSAADTKPLARPASPGTPAGAQPAAETARTETWKMLGNASEALPDAQALKEYQIVVLGRDTERFLTEAALTNLRNWVAREGGALVCYRGSPVAQVDEKLGRLLPVRWSPGREARFRMQLTEQGRDLHWLPAAEGAGKGEMISQMPTLVTATRTDRPKPMAIVLAATAAEGSAGADPVLAYQSYGLGRVVAVEGAGMWRWAFLPPEHQQHDEVYTSLWQSLLRWLVSNESLRPGQDCTLRADKITFSTAEPVTATVLMREEAARDRVPQVDLSGTALKTGAKFSPAPVGDEPGVFRVDFGRLPEGHYQAQIAAKAGDERDEARRIAFDVRSFAEEHLDLKARPDLMARIANDSGGTAIEKDPAAEITRDFDRYTARSRPARTSRMTAWDRWWVFVGIMVTWGVAWGLRRSGGLV